MLTSWLDRSSCREFDHFLLSLKMTSWISPPPQYWISQARKYRWHQAQGKNSGKTKMFKLLWPLSKKLFGWSPGYWHHHPVYMNIWSWPFSSFHDTRVGFLCLLTNCQCCLDENNKSPTLNFNWGQIKKNVRCCFLPWFGDLYRVLRSCLSWQAEIVA